MLEGLVEACKNLCLVKQAEISEGQMSMTLQNAEVLEELRQGKLTDEGQSTMKKVALEVAAQL